MNDHFRKPVPFDPEMLRKLTDRPWQEGRPPANPLTVERARKQLADRKRRGVLFPSSMFGEPAWDMLVALYASTPADKLPQSRLISHSGAPFTSALRWVQFLEERDLIIRQRHPTDGRILLITLTDSARTLLERYFSADISQA